MRGITFKRTAAMAIATWVVVKVCRNHPFSRQDPLGTAKLFTPINHLTMIADERPLTANEGARLQDAIRVLEAHLRKQGYSDDEVAAHKTIVRGLRALRPRPISA